MSSISPTKKAFSSGEKKKKLVIFDYDGVIVDSFPAQYEIYKIIGERFGKQIEPTIEEFSKAFSSGYTKYRRGIGVKPEEDSIADRIYAEESIKRKPRLFEGISEVIETLGKEYIVAIISANYKRNVLDKLVYYQIHHHFSHIIGLSDKSGEVIQKDVEIRKLLSELKLSPRDAVMIGDRIVDYTDAKKAGVDKVILTNYGWGFDKALAPDRVKVEVNEPKDIIKALKSINF